MTRGRVVGIDFGTKRVGIAIADPLRMFSQPVGTYSPDDALLVLDRINEENWISSLVVGWPLEENGQAGRATVRVQQYVNRLKKRYKRAEIVLQDERFSTQSAKEMIKASARPSLKKTGRARVDTAAAGVILQEYLEDTQS